jgi:hypothetical protein
MKIAIFLLGLCLAMPATAAELGNSYVKLFQAQLQIAKGGDAGAEYSLGEMYEEGLGTKPNLKEAYKWYKKAAKLGDPRAQHKIATRDHPDTSGFALIPSAEAASVDPAIVKARRVEHQRVVAKERAAAKRALAAQIAHEQAHDNDIGW